MNKDQLKQTLLHSLDEEIEAAISAATQAQQTAAHEDNKPENQYDTLSLEAAYLAHGQSERILELQQQRIRLAKWDVPAFDDDDEIACGALIQLCHPQQGERWLWLTLLAGGRRLLWQGNAVTVVSSDAPLAQLVLNKGVGDDIRWQGMDGWEITQLQ